MMTPTGNAATWEKPMFKSLSIATLAFLMLAACGDANSTYKFKGVVTGKLLDNGSSEPYRLTFDVSLNKAKAKSVECRLKNPLKPLWEGLRVGGTVRLEKTSTYKYTEKTFCGLLNDAIVKDLLEGQ